MTDKGNRQIADGTNYSANNLNQYSVVGASNYTYDGNGNLTNDGVHTFGYDYENRLTSVVNGPSTVDYAYDGFGRRISKTVGGNTTYFVYDGYQIIEERDASGSLVASYTYGDGIDEPLTMQRAGQSYYYFFDGLGSVTDITNANGEVVESYTYDVYGNPNRTSSIGNTKYFTGRELDSETGLYYYRARMYSPTIGRFLQREPIGMVDGPNPYTYCLNDPINWLDPLGLYRYSTTNWGIASLHESNPFNADSAMRQQMRSWGKFYSGDWAGAAAISGQSIVESTNKCGKASGWQIGYNAAQITAGVAVATAIIADVSFITVVEPRSYPGTDGGISEIVKIINRWTGKTVKVIHRVMRDGKIIHQHIKFP